MKKIAPFVGRTNIQPKNEAEDDPLNLVSALPDFSAGKATDEQHLVEMHWRRKAFPLAGLSGCAHPILPPRWPSAEAKEKTPG